MATLNSSNVSTGNTIQANDVLALYDALTAGGGTTGVYDISISGSLTGSASTATSSSHAVNSDSAISSSHTLNADAAISSSYATTGSYVNTLSSQEVSVLGSAPLPQNLKVVAGSVTLSGGTATSGTFPALAGKVIGNNAFGGVSYFGGASGGAQGIDLAIDATGSVVLTQVGGSTNENVSFLIAYF